MATHNGECWKANPGGLPYFSSPFAPVGSAVPPFEFGADEPIHVVDDAFISQIAPNPPTVILGGSCVPAYKEWFYNWIYVIPSHIAMGRILADFDTSIEVWNAYTDEDKTLQSVDGPTTEETGITLVPVDGDPPTLYPSLISRFFNLNIDFEGPPSVNAIYEFNFLTQIPTLEITGYRIIMFPYVPQEGYIERFKWLTDLIESFDGSEQLIKVRPIPRRELDYTYKAGNTLDRGKFYNILSSSIGYEVGVPIWQQGKNPTQAILPGETRIYIDTTNTEFEVGKPGFLYQDDLIRESFEVAAIAATYLDTVSPIENSYDLDALALPVLICDMPKQISSQLSALNATDLSLTFRGKESTDLGTANLSDQYEGLDVLHDCPEIEGSTLTWTHTGNWQDIDFMTGLMEHDFSVQYAKTTRSFRKTFQEDRAGVWAFKQWLYKIAGRQGQFWIPSYTGKIQPSADITPADSLTIDIVNVDLAIVADNTPFVTDIEIQYDDGQIIRHNILSVVRKSSTEETITLTETLGRDLTKTNYRHLSLLHKVRLESDTVEFRWGDNGTCTVPFNTKELIN